MENVVSFNSEKKTKYIQIRATEAFYNELRSFAKANSITITDCIELGVQLLLEEK